MAEKNENGDHLEQGFIPGMAPKKIPAVHNAALRFEDAHKERIKASKKEKTKRDELVEVMEDNDLTVYEYGDMRVDISNKKTPNVRRTARDNGEENGKAKSKKKAKATA